MWLHLHVFHFLFYSSGFPIRCSALQLFIVLLEVEETDRMKTTALPEAEEKKLVEETQRKVEHIYSQLQHHESVWVTPEPAFDVDDDGFMFLLRINRMFVSNRGTAFLFPCCVVKQRCSRGVSSFLGRLKRQKAVCSAAPLPETSEGADTLESRDHKSAHTDEQRRRRGSRLCPSACFLCSRADWLLYYLRAKYLLNAQLVK